MGTELFLTGSGMDAQGKTVCAIIELLVHWTEGVALSALDFLLTTGKL